MAYLPLIVLLAAIVLLLAFSGRARRRQAANQAEMLARIGVGTEVMTTSGLHGTVVARNEDESVQLAIAPGVEVRWELAALREAPGLPDQYAGGPGAPGAPAAPGAMPGVDPTGPSTRPVELDKPDPDDGRERG